MVCFKEATDKIEYKRNTELATTEVSRHGASCDMLVTHLEDEIYRTLPKVYKLLKQIRNSVKESKNIHVYVHRRKYIFFNTMKNYETQQT
jgi:hypothetical protein